MSLRILSAAIVLFWLGTTGWLVRTLWHQREGHFTPVETEEALGAFFRWNDTTDLIILENGVKIGQMNIAGLEGIDRATGKFSRGLSAFATLDEPAMEQLDSAALTGMNWRLSATFSEANALTGLETKIRVPRQDLDARLEWAGGDQSLAARATVGGVELYRAGRFSDEPAGKDAGVASPAPPISPALAESMLGSLGLPGFGGDGASELGAASGWMPRVEASKGTMESGGRSVPVYLIKLRQPQGGSPGDGIRIYLSEAGEPLRIDTGLGYEAMAEVLLPVRPGKP